MLSLFGLGLTKKRCIIKYCQNANTFFQVPLNLSSAFVKIESIMLLLKMKFLLLSTFFVGLFVGQIAGDDESCQKCFDLSDILFKSFQVVTKFFNSRYFVLS